MAWLEWGLVVGWCEPDNRHCRSCLVSVGLAAAVLWAQKRHAAIAEFGANLATGGFIWALARGSDKLMVGRVYGSESVSLYSGQECY